MIILLCLLFHTSCSSIAFAGNDAYEVLESEFGIVAELSTQQVLRSHDAAAVAATGGGRAGLLTHGIQMWFPPHALFIVVEALSITLPCPYPRALQTSPCAPPTTALP